MVEVIDDIAAQAETHSLLLQAFLNPDVPSLHNFAQRRRRAPGLVTMLICALD